MYVIIAHVLTCNMYMYVCHPNPVKNAYLSNYINICAYLLGFPKLMSCNILYIANHLRWKTYAVCKIEF